MNRRFCAFLHTKNMKFVIRGSSLLEKHPSQLTESVSRGDNLFWVALDFGWFWDHCTHHFFRRPLLGQRRPTTNTYLFLGCLCSGQEAQETHLKFTSYFHQFPNFCHIWYVNSGVWSPFENRTQKLQWCVSCAPVLVRVLVDLHFNVVSWVLIPFQIG